MKGFLLIADSARLHTDGTFSLLRGSIDEVAAPSTQAIHFRGAIIARVACTLSEQGDHEFAIRTLTEDGQSIAPDISGKFRAPEGGGAVNIVVDFALIFPTYGRYSFALLVDRKELDTWEVKARRATPSTHSGGQAQ